MNPLVPDLQCAWQILLQSAGPRCNHLLRTLLPSESSRYARAHDRGMWQPAQSLLGKLPGNAEDLIMASRIATLPMRLGGLGFRCASRVAPAVFWGSWAGALNVSLSALNADGAMHRLGESPSCQSRLPVSKQNWERI